MIIDASRPQEHSKLLKLCKPHKNIRVKYAAPFGYSEPLCEYAANLCRHDWVFRVFAFDRFPDGLISEIKRVLEGDIGKNSEAIVIDRLNTTIDQKPLFIFSNFYIFRKSKTKYDGWIHESGVVKGNIYAMPKQFQVVHLSEYDKIIHSTQYKNLERYMRIERYEHRLTYDKLAEKFPSKPFHWLIGGPCMPEWQEHAGRAHQRRLLSGIRHLLVQFIRKAAL